MVAINTRKKNRNRLSRSVQKPQNLSKKDNSELHSASKPLRSSYSSTILSPLSRGKTLTSNNISRPEDINVNSLRDLKRKSSYISIPEKCIKVVEEEFDEAILDELVDVQGDGNCSYRAVSVGLVGNEEYWRDLKNEVLKYIEDHKEILKLEFDADYIDEAIRYHSAENNWADELIFLMTAHRYNLKLIIESPSYPNSPIYNQECSNERILKLFIMNAIRKSKLYKQITVQNLKVNLVNIYKKKIYHWSMVHHISQPLKAQ